MDPLAFRQQMAAAVRVDRALTRARALLTYDDKWALDAAFGMNGRLAAALGDSDGDGPGAALAALIPDGMSFDAFAPFLISSIVTAGLPESDPNAALRARLLELARGAASSGDPSAPSPAEARSVVEEFMNTLAEGLSGLGAAGITSAIMNSPALVGLLARGAAFLPPQGRLAAGLAYAGARWLLPALAAGAATEAAADSLGDGSDL
jgi:hypothetical protein